MVFDLFYRCFTKQTNRYWFSGPHTENICELASMTDLFYSLSTFFIILFELVIIFFLASLAYKFLSIFINPFYIWLDELRTKNLMQTAEVSQTKCNPKTCKNNWNIYQNIEEEIEKMLGDELDQEKKKLEFSTNTDCSNLETSSSL